MAKEKKPDPRERKALLGVLQQAVKQLRKHGVLVDYMVYEPKNLKTNPKERRG